MREVNIDSNVQQSKWAIWQWFWVMIFAVGFAWVESAVVVYLREIFYNGSFDFPIVVNWDNNEYVGNPITFVELGREAATIIMLASIGLLTGKNPLQKFSFFLIAFGIWDIFYYIWLWVMIGWPEGLLTWDILFLIPLPWVGPVITPVLIAIAMTIAGSLMIYYNEKGYFIRSKWFDWVIILGCGLLMIVAFCWDWKNIIRLPDGVVRSGIPNPFLWALYLPAYILAVLYFFARLRRIISVQRSG